MRELHPSWSRDSKKIVFATWNDADLGAIHSIDVASKKSQRTQKTPDITDVQPFPRVAISSPMKKVLADF